MRCAACYAPIDPALFDAKGACPSCGAPLDGASPTDASTSPTSQVASAPYRAHVEEEARRCPRCDGALAPIDVDAGTLLTCDACGGVFVEAQTLSWAEEHVYALRAHGEATGASARGRSLDGYVKCPLCREVMNRTVFGKHSGVIVDVCRAHGTWFDAGELARALDFIARGGLAEARRHAALDKQLDKERDAAARRAEAEARASLVGEAVAEGRALGRWEGRYAGWSLIDLLRLLLE